MEKRKLNVLMGMDVYLPDTDGVINCMKNYVLQGMNDVNITVIAPKNKRGYVDDVPYKIYRCKSMHIPFINQYYGMPTQDRKFVENVKSQKYDIVHVHSPFNMCKFAIKVAKEQNIPIVATFHTNFRLIIKSLVASKSLTESIVASIGRTYQKMDEVFVCSNNIAEQARSFGYTGKLTVLPFGTELEKTEDVQPLIEKANEEFKLDKDLFLGVFIGRVMPLKRIDFILEALKIVKDQGYKFNFYVVGKGADMKRLKKLCTKLELDNEVKFLGFIPREQFPLVNARADLLLFPSIYDNFGLVKIEAAAYKTAGLFVENTNAGAGIIDGQNGYLSKDDVNEFAKKIIYCIEHREELKQVGQNAQDTIYMHWKDATKLLIDKYYEIVENWEGREEKSKKKSKKQISIEETKLEDKKKAKKIANSYKQKSKKKTKLAM
ncbi:MAG: glycosyltransferase [Clostridia bacterium]|nr:glycosyltransferase [Clostridia bacterium]